MHSIDAGYCCRRHGVAWSVCVLVTTISPAKTAEPIKMPLGGRLAWAKGTIHIVLDYTGVHIGATYT